MKLRRLKIEIARLKREIAVLKLANEQINIDSLTGLKNRHYLNEESIAKMREHRVSKNSDIALFMIDIDHFKRVNDTYGHSIGDIVLKEFAALLQSCTRGSDVVIRWGGEEFLIICKETDRAYISLLGNRILDYSQKHVYKTPKGDIRCTCSVGFICFHQDIPRWREFLDIADTNLYLAKNSGRNKGVGTLHEEDSVAEDHIVLEGPKLDLFLL